MGKRFPLLVMLAFAAFAPAAPAAAAPQLLDDLVDLPPGFHIYKAAGGDLAGGSYVLCFDGEGRLLVGDGQGVRRLLDKDGDQVYEAYETVIADGLRERGPQGLLLDGDRLYAVGADGVQLYSGYLAGRMKHEGRLGEPMAVGGDHDLHELVRGHEDWVYVVGGDGARIGKQHVTEPTSPIAEPQNASVLRFKPDGTKWECIGTDGRNAPGLGMNYLGEMFSFDSDLEYLAGLPNNRPTRLNHWAPGARLGWSLEEHGHRNYFIDFWPAVLDVGRGSPTWATVYEHTQFPARYRDAFISCDYTWKQDGGFTPRRTGRLVAFHLRRDGAKWAAEMSVLADDKPPGPAGTDGKRLEGFALVDVEVAPDGSLMLTDHGQGVWRIFYDDSATPAVPPIVPPAAAPPADAEEAMDQLLALPQPAAEWSRVRAAALRGRLGTQSDEQLRNVALDTSRPPRQRLRAVRLLSPRFETLPQDFLESLAADGEAEVRGQAAWLFGIRHRPEAAAVLVRMLEDADPFVRRRAAEALARLRVAETAAALVPHLTDRDRAVRYAATAALSRFPQETWLPSALKSTHPQGIMRTLVAAQWANVPVQKEWLANAIASVPNPNAKRTSREDRLDVYRMASRYRHEIRRDLPEVAERFSRTLLAGYPDGDPDVRWEQVRLLGEYAVPGSFAPLLAQLERAPDPTSQLHFLRALAEAGEPWTADESGRLVDWLLAAQRKPLNDFSDKGINFADNVRAVTQKLSERHGEAFAAALPDVPPGSALAAAVYSAVGRQPGGAEPLMALHPTIKDSEARRQLLQVVPAPLKPEHAAVFIDELTSPAADERMAQTCAQKLAESKPRLEDFGDRAAQRKVASALLAQMVRHPRATPEIERCFAALAGAARPEDDGRLDRDDRAKVAAAREFWVDWYRGRFNEAFTVAAAPQRDAIPDEQLFQLVLGVANDGADAVRGRAVYLQAGCFACHGGVKDARATLFGPSLAGVTKRLKREELAEALVYPSKRVEDRFKSAVVQTLDGRTLDGVVTNEDEKSLTLVTTLGEVHTLGTDQIAKRRKQELSPMPQGLLNAMSADEVRDLLAYLAVVE